MSDNRFIGGCVEKKRGTKILLGTTAARRLLAQTPGRPLMKSYIAAGAAAFLERRVFRRAGFFAPLRFVFLAAPRAPTLRTVRFFFPFDFRLDFFAVIGM